MSTTKCFILLGLFLVCAVAPYAQGSVDGFVRDTHSGAALAFVTVSVVGENTGTYTDIDGKFEIRLPRAGVSLKFSYLGYETTVVDEVEKGMEVTMTRTTYNLAEATVFPSENPAHRIIRRAIANKKSNDPEHGESFAYDSYNKFVFTLEPDSLVKAKIRNGEALDSSMQDVVNFSNKQHLLMMESVTQRQFSPPEHNKEVVLATRFSGLKNPNFVMLASQLQSFSFYSEEIVVGDYRYLSPLSDGAINKYLFVIEDTTYYQSDTVFIVSFRPRTGKNFDGLKGSLHINTHGYALQHVLAEPMEQETGFTIRVQQKYELLNGETWFPVQLNSFLDLSMMDAETFAVLGIGRTYIDNISIGTDFRRRDFDHVVLSMDPKAGLAPDSLWKKYRVEELDDRELQTYQVIDSLGEAMNFDAKLKIVEALTSGELPIGGVNIDLNQLLRFNGHEGTRLGLGLRTNHTLSTHFSLGGYGAYGFKDNEIKYGGDLKIRLHKRNDVWLSGAFQHDVVESGRLQFMRKKTWMMPDNYYVLFMNRMDAVDKYEAHLSFRALRYLSCDIYGSKELRLPDDDYRFTQAFSESVVLRNDEFQVAQAGASLRLAWGEKFAESNGQLISLGTRFPILYLNYHRGLEDKQGDFAFEKWEAMVEKNFRLLNFGLLTARVEAGYVGENIPAPYLYNARGTKVNFAVTTPFAFETMTVNEFLSSQFVHVHLRHNFEQLLFKAGKFEPHISLVYNAGWGKLEHAANHEGYAIQDYPKGFSEGGIQIDNLIRSNFTGIGIAGFYRFGAYEQPLPKDNLAVKIAVSFVL
jgi:hypothetical protein